jgi:hypothetical protein
MQVLVHECTGCGEVLRFLLCVHALLHTQAGSAHDGCVCYNNNRHAYLTQAYR